MVIEAPPVDAGEVINRMRQVAGVTSDVALGALFRLASSAVGTWRRRGTVPYAECVSLALHHGVSLDWLILGLGPRATLEMGAATGVADAPDEAYADPRVLRMARFLRAWQVGHDADDVAWLERTLARSVPEYAEWLASQTA